jgi:hypothetical protein
MISSIRLDGTTACMHLLGAVDTAAFVTYIGWVLCPTLEPGDIVVMDNLSVHKSPEVVTLVRAEGAEVRFLAAYSPDLNPIEPERSGDSQPQAARRTSSARQKMWSKIKALLRSAEARTPGELDQAISQAFSRITAKGAAGYFASCSDSIIQNALRASLLSGGGLQNCHQIAIRNFSFSDPVENRRAIGPCPRRKYRRSDSNRHMITHTRF